MIEEFKKIAEFDFPKTQFVGYDTLVAQAKVLGVFNEQNEVVDTLTGHGYLCFDITPFYAIAGGQASDQGIIKINDVELKVIDVRKDLVSGYYIHEVENVGSPISVGTEGTLMVDEKWRKYSSINHSSLHIMWQTILRHVGHYVNEVMSKLDRDKYQLQYVVDQSITPELVWAVTNEFNQKIIPADIKANIFLVTQQEAEEKGYLYEFTKIDGDELVRMVEFPTIVIEPCSGTHMESTKDAKYTWFLDYDLNSKRIFIEMTSNPEYAAQYFNEKLVNRFEEIKQLVVKAQNLGIKLDFDSILKQGESLLETWNYFSVKAMNELYNEVSFAINKALKEMEKAVANEIKALDLQFTSSQNFLIAKTKNDLYTNKMLLGKISSYANNEKDKVIVFINEQSNGANLILMRNRDYDFSLKTLLPQILATTSFKGGGTDSMVQMVSSNPEDIQKVCQLFQ